MKTDFCLLRGTVSQLKRTLPDWLNVIHTENSNEKVES